ncbi:hypothetical protein ALC53_13483 [Atta colombica]|uniref:Uncharacterized protein n=1 Tax=Atta colombica TaxID=520822 RepID=A0A195AUT3_9HYME|nr:hypothetical protein ALC53_13483 [Atta colombica]
MQCSSMCALCSQRIAADRPESISDVVRRVSEQGSQAASQAVKQAGRRARWLRQSPHMLPGSRDHEESTNKPLTLPTKR